MSQFNDTIIAIATPPGEGAIGIIRLSGPEAIGIAAALFAGKRLAEAPTHTLHFGRIVDEGRVVDEVVTSLYRSPKSYTGEDVVELSCHGSAYILQRIMQLCMARGARMAKPGEFTQRAFLNGKLDLTQAEAVADLIASESASAHKAAMHNLKGGFSNDLQQMRDQLIQFSALIELELDFSEEDVEFADRTAFITLIEKITLHTRQLVASFSLGNVIKNGVNVAITGKPNAGKSTLLNALLHEDRAIVSEIAGTTRDTIEATMNIEGVLFRMVDTAGLRDHTLDLIEQQGIARSREAITRADVVIHLFDLNDERETLVEALNLAITDLQSQNKKFILAGNKADTADSSAIMQSLAANGLHPMMLAAKAGTGVDELKAQLVSVATAGQLQYEGTIVTNARHLGALSALLTTLTDIRNGLNTGLSGELLSLDIRHALHYLGDITGQVTTEDKLDYIFSKFCIGK